MQCPQCQHENREGARFCRECGTRFDAVCPACGARIEAGSKYCDDCGAPLTGARATAAPSEAVATPSRFASPGAYTPQHLADRILTSRIALEGERKQVTVLFADLKGSMELLADRDPEEARRVLDPVLERMMDAVHRYEGTVNQVMGDGIMALFGAPLAHEDHAVRAAYAALRMQESVARYADTIRATVGVPLQIRVGLNSGEVVVRSIGSDLRMDYTAVGQTTHLAARMEQVAAPGSILVAPDTLRLVEGYVQVRGLGRTAVKGLSEPVDVYELLGAGPVRSRLQALAARGLSKFVGRNAELETLRQTLAQAGAGHGQIVALVGEPGVGKSRLVWEFTHSHRAQGWLVLESGSVSYGKATSWLPVIDLLKSYCGIEAADDQRRIREKVTGKVLTLDPALQAALPALLALLDVPVEDAAWENLDSAQRRQRTLDAVKRLLLRESQEQPLLLVFEDLHWIDAETQALLDSLAESLPTARVLLLVNYRPEYEHSWGRKTYYRQLRLDPLPPESADELLRALLGDDASLAELKRLLVERTEGNPFFLEETARTLVETGVLSGERGAYTLTRPLESTGVPATVQAVLAARIDRLPPEDKRLLQCAAVIGKDVPFALLQAIAELREDWLRQGLADLQAAEFLYETRLFPELEYTFKHALTHEVAYGSLLSDRRRALHGRIVEVIERQSADRLAEQVERLAHHAVRGEVWDKAVSYLRQAGAKAAVRGAYREAAGYFEQARVALEHLPERRATQELAIDLRFELRNALLPIAGAAEQQRIIELLREAETLAHALDDRRRLGWVEVYLGSYAWQTGALTRAVELGRSAVANAEALGDLALTVAANWALGPALSLHGDYREGAAVFSRNVELLRGERLQESFGLPFVPSVQARALQAAWCLAELGEFGEGVARGEEAVRMAEAADHPFSKVGAYYSVARLYLLKGDFDRAIALLEHRRDYLPEGQNRATYAAIAIDLAYAHARSGRPDRAIALLERASDARPMVIPTRLHSLIWLGQAHLLLGRLDDARGCAAEALDDARAHELRGGEARALWLLGEVAAAAEPPDAEQAEAHYHQALARAAELEMRPLVAHCKLGLGTLHRKLGRRDEARAELQTAAEMCRVMDMTFWVERAEAQISGLNT
jgi:class 3 adenylate cyclase/tetratricopeptide (TPR) repeat protein